MSPTGEYRKLTILICGAMVALTTFLMPVNGRAGDPPPPDCQDVWYEYCVASEANCITGELCELYCSNIGCSVEWDYCEPEPELCPDPERRIQSECSCM